MLSNIPFRFYGERYSEVVGTNLFYVKRSLDERCSKCYLNGSVRIAKYFNGTSIQFEDNYTVTDIIDVKYCELVIPQIVTLEPPGSFCKRNKKGKCDESGNNRF